MQWSLRGWLRGTSFRDSLVECLGTGACRPQGFTQSLARHLTEVVLRIAVADDSRAAVERFSRELMPLVTAGPPGTTGYAAGRPKVQLFSRYWPCLAPCERVTPQVQLLGPGEDMRFGKAELQPDQVIFTAQPPDDETSRRDAPQKVSYAIETPYRLADLAHTRSGDKGINANIAVIARAPDDYARLCHQITAVRVGKYLGIDDASRVTRYEVPNLSALNFVIRGILANPLRTDVQGKALGQVLLEMPLEDD